MICFNVVQVQTEGASAPARQSELHFDLQGRKAKVALLAVDKAIYALHANNKLTSNKVKATPHVPPHGNRSKILKVQKSVHLSKTYNRCQLICTGLAAVVPAYNLWAEKRSRIVNLTFSHLHFNFHLRARIHANRSAPSL